jgi:MFS family permease
VLRKVGRGDPLRWPVVAVARISSERRLVLVIGAVVFVDLMFYAAIAPLLPGLARELHLSKLSAGVMTAGYPAGVLIGSLPGGILAVRAGAKQTVIVGLLLLSVSTLAFGWLDTTVLLDLARFWEGFGSACAWAGGLAWIVSETPAARRGGAIGNVLGAAVAGSLFGPVIGTVADAVGRGPAFSGVVLVSLVLADQVRRLPLLHTSSGQGLRALAGAARNPELAGRMWLVLLPAIASGALFVLGPLRLHRFGAAAGVIGAVYLIGAALEASLAPLVGRFSDRRGRMLPVRIGLATTIPLLLGFSLPHAVLPLAVLIIALEASLSSFWAPSMAMLSDAAEALRLDQALAAALINLAWAGGQIIGSTGGGGLAKTAGDAAPMAVIAGLCAVTLVGVMAPVRRRVRS